MAAKIGTSGVQFHLGANPVSAYLGSAPVSRTLYFNAVLDDDWEVLGNWWLDAAHTVAAPSLPSSGDSVVASATITAAGQTVLNFTLGGPEDSALFLYGTLTVTGQATFYGSNSGTVEGNATFNGGGLNTGTVTGNATFTGSSVNQGEVLGTATFTDFACDDGGAAGTYVPDPPPSC